MTATGSLAALLQVKSNITYETLQLSRISKEYETIHKQLESMENYYQKWQKKFDDAQDTDKTINEGGFKKDKGEVFSDKMADAYAHYKVQQYDAKILDQLAEDDLKYENLKTILETSLTEQKAEEESWKNLTTTEVQNTGLLGG